MDQRRRVSRLAAVAAAIVLIPLGTVLVPLFLFCARNLKRRRERNVA